MQISKKLRFAIASALALVSTVFLIQLVDPSVFGEKHPTLCWVAGIGLALASLYIFYTIIKDGGGSSNMVK